MTRIEQKDNNKKGRFILYEGDKKAGEMTYVWVDDYKIIIDHTEVDTVYGGKGYGKVLVMEAVKFARKQDIKIIPLCPFAKKVFDNDSDIQDVRF
ncbi:MAG: GNAT family N-acetyltransferase [Fermentimonas sp.]|nr:GNAT family N-acetyltransferase [Fermentimonas sp.]